MPEFFGNAPKVGEGSVKDENKPEGRFRWNWALKQATSMMQPIAKRLGQKNVAFSPQNDELVVLPKDEIDDICHGVLETLSPKTFYGCTTQKAWQGGPDGDYIKPSSTTYLAQEWDDDHISNAVNHELSHQAIFTARQMLQKDHQNRRNKGYSSLSNSDYKDFVERFFQMDRDLDSLDVAEFDEKKGPVVIDKKSDVWFRLEDLVNEYEKALQWGQWRIRFYE
ncbi:hypothetical protein [uncultured Fibrobacter sp.]|uniref:hypothetical protein n=1 Tax=uncultured Fibrobacter sp. TaxID=261512 RepID=UPI002804E859|nr:hypothetical protein [uncultured Fibrobacter sp.]